MDREAEEHKYVGKAVDEALHGEQIILNTVIIMEVAHYLIKNLGPMMGKAKLETFLSYPFVIVDLSYELTLDAIDELATYSHLGVGGRDATILAFMKRNEVKKIMTHDAAFRRIGWLQVVDPISET